MPTYNIATYRSHIGTTFTTTSGSVTYTLTPSGQTSAPYIYHSPPNQTNIPASSFDDANGNSRYNKNYIINLLTFTCGDNVTIINDRAFVYCSVLTSIILSNKVTNINYGSISSCVALTTITIPATVTNIGQYAFLGDSSLNKVYFLGSSMPTIHVQSAFTSSPIAYVYYASLIPSFTATGYFSQVIYIPPPYPCFKEGSKILTMDGYVPIEKLRKGDLVQTLKNSYLPIVLIGKSTMYNSGDKERIKDRLYTLSTYHYPDLTEDLVLTGCHSILVDRFTLEQEKATLENYGTLKVTDGKGRLETYLDTRATPYKKEGNFTIYHLALENDNYYGNYGIWANGLLVESCSKRYLTEISNMELIH